jgi:hypothetical protein
VGAQGRLGFVSSGHFQLGNNEALVVTLDRLRADYLGFQLSDPWGVAPEYGSRNGSRNGSLNRSQAKANPDGTYIYVIAADDPGVYKLAGYIRATCGNACDPLAIRSPRGGPCPRGGRR